MSEDVDLTVAILKNAIEQITALQTAERMDVGEKLAFILRQSGTLTTFEYQTLSYSKRCSIEAGPVTLNISASFRTGRFGVCVDTEEPKLPF